MVVYRTALNPGDLGSMVKITVTWYLFFHHNSLLISQFCISALLCPMYLLDMSLVNLSLNFIKFELVMTLRWCHLSFLRTIVHISNSFEHTNFILGIKVTVTLTDGEGQRWRSKVTKNKIMVISCKLLHFIPGTKVQYNKRNLMTKAFLTLT